MGFSYPVFLDVEDRLCVVVGAGKAGTEKVHGLLTASARVRVIDESPSDEVQEIAAQGRLELRRKRYSSGDLQGAFMVLCATGDSAVDAAVASEGKERGILVNLTSESCRGDFIVPAMVRRGDLTLAASTGGRSPSLAKLVRERLENHFGPEWGAAVDIAAGVRAEARRLPDRDRAGAMRTAFGPETLALLRDGRKDAAGAQVRSILGGKPRGFVSLVGAGPGDPGLITVAGRDRLATAEVILYDRLAHPSLLDLAPADAERIYIGKSYGKHVLDQEELNNLLVFLAGQGRRVVRLKGGDPFVFGRGGEEASALARAQVPFEVVPGITSAVGVPAYAGIPVTDRRFGSSVAVVTGHKDPRDEECPVDWMRLATAVDTIVVLMGIRNARLIADAIMEGGRRPDTPAAVIESGTHAHQRVVICELADLAGRARAEGFGSPSVIVIGGVVSLAGSLSWFGGDGAGSGLAAAGRLLSAATSTSVAPEGRKT